MNVIKTSGYTVQRKIDENEYPPIPGLEGPFRMKNGRIVYYDPKSVRDDDSGSMGQYYDRKTDMYLSKGEEDYLHDDKRPDVFSSKDGSPRSFTEIFDLNREKRENKMGNRIKRKNKEDK